MAITRNGHAASGTNGQSPQHKHLQAPIPANPHIDPLSQILDKVRLGALMLERARLRAPWGFQVPVGADGRPIPPANGSAFMLPPNIQLPKPPAADGFVFAVLEGSCILELEKRPPIKLVPGGYVIVNGALSHTLRDSATSNIMPFWDVLRHPDFPPPGTKSHHPPIPRMPPLRNLLNGTARVPRPPSVSSAGAGAETSLMMGLLLFEPGHGRKLLASLPSVLNVPADPSSPPWLREVLSAIEHEQASAGPGTFSVISRLVHSLFDHAVRSHIRSLAAAVLPVVSKGQSEEHHADPATDDPTARWIHALMDDDIGPAIAAMHESPAEPWTVQSLAAVVAMSRSTFAERFTELVGEPPLRYLLAFRLRCAAQLILAGDVAIKEVAARVGYESLAAFSNAFKRELGVSPGAYRRSKS